MESIGKAEILERRNGDIDYAARRRSYCGQDPYMGRYAKEDGSHSPLPMKYVLTKTERRAGVTNSSHRGKGSQKDNEGFSVDDQSTPSRSQAPKPPSGAESSRRHIAEEQDQMREERLPNPFMERPDGTGSGVVDYLLNKYTTYFER